MNNNTYKEDINKSANINIRHIKEEKNVESIEKNLKQEKMRLNKEKAKEIERNNINNIIYNNKKERKLKENNKKNNKTIKTKK